MHIPSITVPMLASISLAACSTAWKPPAISYDNTPRQAVLQADPPKPVQIVELPKPLAEVYHIHRAGPLAAAIMSLSQSFAIRTARMPRPGACEPATTSSPHFARGSHGIVQPHVAVGA